MTGSTKTYLIAAYLETRNLTCEFSTTLKLGPNVHLTYHYCLVYYKGDGLKYDSPKVRIWKSYTTAFCRAGHINVMCYSGSYTTCIRNYSSLKI